MKYTPEEEEEVSRMYDERIRGTEERIAWCEANMHLMGAEFTEEELQILKNNLVALRNIKGWKAYADALCKNAEALFEEKKRLMIKKHGQAWFDAVIAGAKRPKLPH